MDDSRKKLILTIIQFLEDEVSEGTFDEENEESLEVAIQCLQSTYGITDSDKVSVEKINLHATFKTFLEKGSAHKHAENLKEEGNNLMRISEYYRAIECYSEAIKLNPDNAKYFCNRAAAFDKVKKYEEAISDCKEAIKLDPLYSKAYARLGNTYVNLGKYQEAKESYMNALRYDENNADYRANLNLCEDNIKENINMTHNFSNLLSTPNVMNLTTRLLSDPNSVRNLFSTLVTSDETHESDTNIENLARILTNGMNLNNSETVEELLASLSNGSADASVNRRNPK